MYRISNRQNVRWTKTECACGTRLGNSVTCPVVDHLQFGSNEHQRIHTGYLPDAERMRTGQTARKSEKTHTNARVIGWLALLLYVPSQHLWSLQDGQFT